MMAESAAAASESTRFLNGWNLSQKIDQSFDGQANPPIAEPLARVGSYGSSSGISLRKLPAASLSQIVKICNHYKSKCSGKYHNSPLAARYLFQMAQEIIMQVNALQFSIDEVNSGAKAAKETMNEYNKYFGINMNAQQDLNSEEDSLAGLTPQQIAARLQQQARRARELEAAAAAARGEGAREGQAAGRAEGARAAARGGAEARRRHEVAIRHLIQKHLEKVNEMELAKKQALEMLSSEKDEAYQKLGTDLSSQIKKLNDLIVTLEKEKAMLKKDMYNLSRKHQLERDTDNDAWGARLDEAAAALRAERARLAPTRTEKTVSTQDYERLQESLYVLNAENMQLRQRQEELETLLSACQNELAASSTPALADWAGALNKPTTDNLNEWSTRVLGVRAGPSNKSGRRKQLASILEQQMKRQNKHSPGCLGFASLAEYPIQGPTDQSGSASEFVNEWDRWPREISRTEYLYGTNKRAELGDSERPTANPLFQCVLSGTTAAARKPTTASNGNLMSHDEMQKHRGQDSSTISRPANSTGKKVMTSSDSVGERGGSKQQHHDNNDESVRRLVGEYLPLLPWATVPCPTISDDNSNQNIVLDDSNKPQTSTDNNIYNSTDQLMKKEKKYKNLQKPPDKMTSSVLLFPHRPKVILLNDEMMISEPHQHKKWRTSLGTENGTM